MKARMREMLKRSSGRLAVSQAGIPPGKPRKKWTKIEREAVDAAQRDIDARIDRRFKGNAR